MQKISFTQKAIEKISYWHKLLYVRDRATIAYSDWFKANGDKDLRLNHNLNADSIVFSVGAFKGDFAYNINFKYGSKVFLFEPVNEYYQECVNRFIDNKKNKYL